MKNILINKDNLNVNDLDLEVIRVKALIINKDNKILVAHNNNTYQLVGGHVSKTENEETAMKREIREETGIYLTEPINPFMKIIEYNKNHLNSGKNVRSIIYYYRIVTDLYPDFKNTCYDKLERLTPFNLFYINMKDLPIFLDKCLKEGSIERTIYDETLFVIDEYNKLFD